LKKYQVQTCTMFKLLKHSKILKPTKLVNLRTVTDYRIATQTQGKTQHQLKNAPDDRDTLKLGDGLDDVNTQLLATGKEPKEDSFETAVSISELDENKNQLKKTDQPPPLPPVRYEEEVVYMPTLLTAENAMWYGAHGWDAPDFKNHSEEDRIEMFERRRRDLPTGFSYAGKVLQVRPDANTGELTVSWGESSKSPVTEMVKRGVGRVGRQFSHLDRNDDMYETRVRQGFDMLEMMNNKNSILQYDKYSLKTMMHRDQQTGKREYERRVAKVGYDMQAGYFIENMAGAYRLKLVDIADAQDYNEWFYTGGLHNKIYEDAGFSKKQIRQEAPTFIDGATNSSNAPIWWKSHVKLEAVDLRFSLIDQDGLEKFDGCKNVRYLNLEGCRFIDDWAMSKLHIFQDSLEYLDLSQTRITLKGFNYVHLLKNLKYLNLSNMIDLSDSEIEEIIPLLRQVLPPDCSIVTSFKSNPDVPLLSAGPDYDLSEKITEVVDEETGSVVKYEKYGDMPIDIAKMWDLNKIGKTKNRNTKRRQSNLLNMNKDFDKKTNYQLLHYINRANTKKPLW